MAAEQGQRRQSGIRLKHLGHWTLEITSARIVLVGSVVLTRVFLSRRDRSLAQIQAAEEDPTIHRVAGYQNSPQNPQGPAHETLSWNDLVFRALKIAAPRLQNNCDAF